MVDEEPDRRRQFLPSPGAKRFVGASGRTAVVRVAPPLVTLAGLLLAWQALVTVYAIPTLILPSPAEVARALAETYSVLLADAAVTALTAGAGLLAGAALGLALAFSMTASPALTRAVLPHVVALRIAPLIAIAPLLFLWFGRGVPARALLVASLTLFPMTVATLDGLRGTPPSYLALMESVAAPGWRVFLRVRVPAAVPSVLAGAKIAATLSVIGAVVAEFVALDAGLGYRVFYTATFLRTAESFAALVVLSLLGVGFYLLPVAAERAVRR
ncbi:ABC transporter permease [Halalkalicoccus sp. NIPERK01]|uniref:ABC transporter permease n=1 Tax=Halalkalicoccus sp. NIPERK01 TaxID=3053469 RepID=UPI00256EAA91|nr:ABC transporter permease [Halalkalicoccus sp. NIPERK01]MDL5362478.1 ABC transporter permease [Halalkalicoccus sp. NIPERK01]